MIFSGNSCWQNTGRYPSFISSKFTSSLPVRPLPSIKGWMPSNWIWKRATFVTICSSLSLYRNNIFYRNNVLRLLRLKRSIYFRGSPPFVHSTGFRPIYSFSGRLFQRLDEASNLSWSQTGIYRSADEIMFPLAQTRLVFTEWSTYLASGIWGFVTSCKYISVQFITFCKSFFFCFTMLFSPNVISGQ